MGMLDYAVVGGRRPGLPELRRFLEPVAQRLELADDGVDVVAEGTARRSLSARSPTARRRGRRPRRAGRSSRRRRSRASWATVRSAGPRVELGLERGGRLLQVGRRALPRSPPARRSTRAHVGSSAWMRGHVELAPAPRRGRCRAWRSPSTRARRRRRRRATSARRSRTGPGCVVRTARLERARGRPGPSERSPATDRASRDGSIGSSPLLAAERDRRRGRPGRRTHGGGGEHGQPAQDGGRRAHPGQQQRRRRRDRIGHRRRARLRSMPRLRGASEVGDHGGEHLVDARRVAGVVGGRVGGLGDAAEHAQVGVLAVGDGEDAHRACRSGPRCRSQSGRAGALRSLLRSSSFLPSVSSTTALMRAGSKFCLDGVVRRRGRRCRAACPRWASRLWIVVAIWRPLSPMRPIGTRSR